MHRSHMEYLWKKELLPQIRKENKSFVAQYAISNRELEELRQLMAKAGIKTWSIEQENDGLHIIKSGQ